MGFLAIFTNENISDFLSNEMIFDYFVATCSRTNGNWTQNACTENENGIPLVRERTVELTTTQLTDSAHVHTENLWISRFFKIKKV